MKNSIKIGLITLLMAALAIIAVSTLSSCSSSVPQFKTKRVVVLENNTVSFVHIPIGLDSIYRNDDTVWVNLITHRIDDSDSNTMCAVIKP